MFVAQILRAAGRVALIDVTGNEHFEQQNDSYFDAITQVNFFYMNDVSCYCYYANAVDYMQTIDDYDYYHHDNYSDCDYNYDCIDYDYDICQDNNQENTMNEYLLMDNSEWRQWGDEIH